MGIKRRDITALPVRFWTLARFPNYVIVYRPETVPLQVIAILHGKREPEKSPGEALVKGLADELVQDVIEGYFDELAQTRSMLNSRYDDLKGCRVKPIRGNEVEGSFRDKSAALAVRERGIPE